MTQMNLASKLEMHYYFDDISHSMDALVRNRCEAEILAIIYETAKTLDISVIVESEVRKEGGLRDLWQLMNNNAGSLSVVVAVLALVLSRVPTSDPELDNLRKEDLKLSIQERKLRIKKLKQEVKAENFTQKTVIEAADVVDENYKVTTRKSNLYKSLNQYKKVTKVGVNTLNSDGIPINDELIVERNDFPKFIMHSNVLPVQVVESAEIEIVSPVLKEGNYKWKGIYEGEAISFSMRDKDFKEDVLFERISFQHSSAITCVLCVHKKLDEIGEIVITGYSVETVLDNLDGQKRSETVQGKRYRHHKKMADKQGDLFA
ncbi:hypothetical protein L4D21_23715 [Photobacterium profundum]|uniref:hypothetical protein n=1 Tax=Photobacterium profundum TaxID=74109 RepID=UPI003D1366FC